MKTFRYHLLLKLLISVCVLHTAVPIFAQTFSDLYIFGDSLSDTGNLFAASRGAFPPDPPYDRGRASNGQVWVEILARNLGHGPVVPSLLGGNNHAYAGALAGVDLPNTVFIPMPVPSVRTQVQNFLRERDRVDPEALYIIWGGANDLSDAFLSGTSNPDIAIRTADHIAESVRALADRGAVHILVVGFPGSWLPETIRRFGDQAGKAATDAFNDALESSLRDLDHLNLIFFTREFSALLDRVRDNFVLTQSFSGDTLTEFSLLLVSVHENGAPVEGVRVEFSRSISGRSPDYAWTDATGADGITRIETVFSAPPSGYYLARAVDPATGETLGRWGSIPISDRTPQHLVLPIGGRAHVKSGASIDAFLSFDFIGHPTAVWHRLIGDAVTDAVLRTTPQPAAKAALAEFALLPAFPNPSNPSTTIRYTLPEPAPVRLQIYNALGQSVRLLVDETRAPGAHSILWDGRDNLHRPVASGVYIYRLEAGRHRAVRKLLLIK